MHTQAQQFPIQSCMVALYETGLLQQLDPAPAGRLRQGNLLGQFGYGQPTIANL